MSRRRLPVIGQKVANRNADDCGYVDQRREPWRGLSAFPLRDSGLSDTECRR